MTKNAALRHATAAASEHAITIPLCQHMKPNGTRCGSPARRGRSLCYFHGPDRPALHRARRTYNPYAIPPANDPYAIATVLHRIMNDLFHDRADLTCTRRALASIYSLALATSDTGTSGLMADS